MVRTQVGVADTQNFANTNVLTTGGEPPYSTIGICEAICVQKKNKISKTNKEKNYGTVEL